jgi:hypothetical protein
MSEMRKVPGKDTIFGDVEAAERFATGKNLKIEKLYLLNKLEENKWKIT